MIPTASREVVARGATEAHRRPPFLRAAASFHSGEVKEGAAAGRVSIKRERATLEFCLRTW